MNKDLTPFTFDLHTSLIATDYSGHLRDDDHNETFFNNLLEQEKCF